MRIYTTLNGLANKFHRMFHRVIYGKNPNHEADYYDCYVAYFDRRFDDIEKKISKIQSDMDFYIKNYDNAETPPKKQ